jgi:hypothetical protein
LLQRAVFDVPNQSGIAFPILTGNIDNQAIGVKKCDIDRLMFINIDEVAVKTRLSQQRQFIRAAGRQFQLIACLCQGGSQPFAQPATA